MKPRSKEPFEKGGFHNATADVAMIERLWAHGPFNIGCEPAAFQRNGARAIVFDLDVDDERGVNGFEVLGDRERRYGPLPATATVITGGYGEQRWFWLPVGVICSSNAATFGVPGIDVRCKGGYGILPPSIHPNGRTYEWDASGDRVVELPQAWVKRLLAPQNGAQGERKTIQGIDDDSIVAEGERHQVLLTFSGRLAHDGMDAEQILAALIAYSKTRFNPPHSEAEIDELRRIAESAFVKYGMTNGSASDGRSSNALCAWPLRSAADVALDGVPPVAWDVEGLIERESGPVIIFGMPESLKSWIALHLSRCMVTGEPVFGHFAVTPRPKAVYLNFDAPGSAFERRVALIKQGARRDAMAKLLFDSPEIFEADRLRATLAEYRAAFITIDCFADAYSADPKTEPGQAMREWVRGARKLYEAHQCNGVIVDHSRRPKPGDPAAVERYYGNVQKKAASRQMWFVERLRQAGGDPAIIRAKIVCEKQGEAEKFAPFVIEAKWSPESVTLRYVGPLSEEVAKVDAAVRHRELIEPYLKDDAGGLTATQLTEKTKLSRKQILAAMKTPGIAATGKGRNRRYILCEAIVGDNAEDQDPDGESFLPAHTLG
ncbi:MAG: bifunctional DNA primase/polymerase, partial [Candidatus Cybelea sp.]